MKTPLAWLQLIHYRRRTLVAVAGIAFTVVLLFLQLGFFGSVEATATLLYDQLDFDILLVSPGYSHLTQARTFPRRQLFRALEVPGVSRAVPVYAGFQLWRSRDDRRAKRQVLVLGVRCSDPVFRLAELQQALPGLQSGNVVLTDRLCRGTLGPMGPGDEATELGPVSAQVLGQFTLGTGFGADGLVVASDQTFSRVRNGQPLHQVSLGLLKLDPGARSAVVVAELRRLLGADVQALTRAEVLRRERTFWVSTTSVGIMFGVGVGVAFIAGMVFFYQVISSDFRKHAAEFATLKALGYRKSFLTGVVLQQALILAVLGYSIGLPLSLALYELTRWIALVPIAMNLPRVVLVLLLTASMCGVSGLLCVRKVHLADPASLF